MFNKYKKNINLKGYQIIILSRVIAAELCTFIYHSLLSLSLAISSLLLCSCILAVTVDNVLGNCMQKFDYFFPNY